MMGTMRPAFRWLYEHYEPVAYAFGLTCAITTAALAPLVWGK